MSTSLPSTFTISEFFRFGWEKLKMHWKYLLKYILLIVVVSMVSSGFSGYLAENVSGFLGLIVSLLMTVFSIVINMVLIVMMLSLIRTGKEITVDEALIKEQFPQIIPYLWVSFLYSFRVMTGLILLIIPGIIWMAKYQFATVIVIDKKMSAGDAMRRSAEITEGKVGQLLLFWLVMTGVIFLGALAFGIGLIIAVPVAQFAYYAVYEYLDKQTPVKE